MSIKREAARDAHEYARAAMFYGEGAGIRRRLIENSVHAKINRNPSYERAFEQAMANEDMSKHAKKARTERRRIDTSHAVHKNVRALQRGDLSSLSTGLLVTGGAAYLAHQLGYDKVALDFVKDKYKNVRSRFKKTPETPVFTIFHQTD